MQRRPDLPFTRLAAVAALFGALACAQVGTCVARLETERCIDCRKVVMLK